MLIFDLETNGLLDTLDTIHCIVTYDTETGEYQRYNDQDDDTPSIYEGIHTLENADAICGHNIQQFDVKAIKKRAGKFNHGKIVDTLIISRLIWTDLKDRDYIRIAKKDCPKEFRKLIGSHSLKAWGYRLGILKDGFGDTNDWSTWSKEMEDYCHRDVEVTVRLWEAIAKQDYSQEAIDLEHRVAEILGYQESFGWRFDEEKAEVLLAKLTKRLSVIDAKLQETFQPWQAYVGRFIPKANNKKYGYVKGVPVEKYKTKVFNPASRDHIADRLQTLYGWKPKEFTEAGKPKVDEGVLKGLQYEPVPLLIEYLVISKRLGQLAEGRNAWLKSVKNGRIHGRVNHNGAVTGRMTHSKPNVAQVPASHSPFGKYCRELFTVDEGYKLVGADASGLELRCLAHYMAKWDNGRYVKEILEGDIHSANQKAAGLPTRDQAKTFIYALIYGGGDAKIGEIVGKGHITGKKLKQKFFKNLPALGTLLDRVGTQVNLNKHLRGLDGRRINIRKAYSAPNALLQGAGALIMKQALVIAWNEAIINKGYILGEDFMPVGNIHDELQWQVKEEHAENFGKIFVDAMRRAGEHFSFRCPIDGEYKIGDSWAETH